MTKHTFNSRSVGAIGATTAFLLFGLYLFLSPASKVLPVEDQTIYDLIWLDAWSLSFLFTLALIWISSLATSGKAWTSILVLAVYGAIEIALIFHGTPFSLNAYWGDQKFRQAMLTKFLTWAMPGDFYYKGLGPFYPPAYYLGLAWIGRLFAWRSWELMKIGSLLIYLVWPPVLYICWRRLTGSIQAWLIVLFTMLICSHNSPYVLAAPHAFLANSLFIPWWLIYVERVPDRPFTRSSLLLGGVIGALIFSTYFYPFLIAGFLLLLRLTILRGWNFFARPPRFQWRSALSVLGLSALLSAPFWLPVLLAIARNGADRSRGGWHHIGSPGLSMPFLSVTIAGMLFLAGIWYVLRRSRNPLKQGLLVLFGSAIAFWLLGSILGALDMPVNLVKDKDWLLLFAGPMIGLLFAALLRLPRVGARRFLVPVLTFLVLISFVNTFGQSIKNPMVQTARSAKVPDWGLDEATGTDREGALYLSGIEEFFSFYPVYSFIAANEHYSHPASRFKQRFDMLALLHDLQNPGAFALALRHNTYDTVEYFMPLARQGELQLLVSLSNYPNGLHTFTFGYPRAFVNDRSLFEPVVGRETYRLHDPIGPVDSTVTWSAGDTIKFALLTDFLSKEGRVLMANYTQIDLSQWHSLLLPWETRLNGDALDLVGSVARYRDDSVDVAIAYRPFHSFPDSCRVYLHVTAGGEFHNFDYDPPRPVPQWPIDSLILLQRTIPNLGDDMRIMIGLYTPDGPLDGGLVAKLKQ